MSSKIYNKVFQTLNLSLSHNSNDKLLQYSEVGLLFKTIIKVVFLPLRHDCV